MLRYIVFATTFIPTPYWAQRRSLTGFYAKVLYFACDCWLLHTVMKIWLNLEVSLEQIQISFFSLEKKSEGHLQQNKATNQFFAR